MDNYEDELNGGSDRSIVEEMSDEMQAEYDIAFTGEERTSQLLRLDRDKFSIRNEVIAITDIACTDPIKKGREDTVLGLTQSVKDMGVLYPIQVMLLDSDEDNEGPKYVLIDGLRRIYASMKNRLSTIPAIVWDFKDKDRALELLLPLGLMLNKEQKRSWKEIWHLYRVLELQSAITPGTLEYLLQLEGGEAMRLKDVMLCEYDEVKQALLSGEKNLDASYKLLEKLRKEENQIARDDATGFGDTVEDASDVTTDMTQQNGQLSDQDVLELLEMVDAVDAEVTSGDFSEMESDYVEQQRVGERHPLDPALRQAVLANDNFCCRCCGMEMKGIRSALQAVHHVIPVHCGGKDAIENLVLLCLNCHNTLHCLERNNGQIMMNEEMFKQLLPSEQNSLRKALKFAKIAIQADKRRGMSRESIERETRDAVRHPMPGVNLRENLAITNRAMAEAAGND